MDTYKVTAWNTYKMDGTGKMVIRKDYDARSITEAMDKAAQEARNWNRMDPALRVNFITCNGKIRTI
jgi:hypothetical protein